MKILIVGSKGFIGAHALAFFQDRNEVWGCDVFTDYNEKNFFLINPSNADFHEIFRHHQFDVCINCSGAASVPDSIKNPARDFELNVHNVLLLLEAIRQNNIMCRFINISSAAVYGNPTSLPVAESHPLAPLSPYGFHKWQAEQLCSEYFRFFSVPTCSLRIFSAYGPGLKKQLLWDLNLKSQNSSVISLFGSGEESRDYIFIDDIVRALDCVIEKAPFQADVYNIAFGEPSNITFVSKTFFDALSWKGSVVFTGDKRKGDPDFWQADISKIAALGFVPKITLIEGIKRYIQWLKLLA